MDGTWIASNRLRNGVSRREFAGRCIVKTDAERESRAGMLISLARMVQVRALPNFPPASTPAARVKL